MKYDLKKKVLDLRKNLFEEFFEMQQEDEEMLTDDKMVSIDSIIALLSTYNYSIDKVEDEIKERDEMSYYELEDLTDTNEKALTIARKLKKEILKNFFELKKGTNVSDIAIDLDDEKEYDLKYTSRLRGKIITLTTECSNLKKLLEKENFKSETLTDLSLKIEEMYRIIDDIYNNVNMYDEIYNDEYEYGNINDEIEDDYYDEYTDDEILELDEEWKNTSMFNYDISSIDSIYVSIFGEINDPERLLICLMIADFYEYHKVNKLFEFKEEENPDVIETIDFIENSSKDDNIQRFLCEPIWAEYIIDSYIYYNVNSTPSDKLVNRMAISELNKLDVLKTYNPYINETLKDETLYNLFITPINNLIRTATYNLTIELEVNEKESTEKLLTKYFITDFLPNNDDYIPEQLKKAKIKDLKKLQLKFIISDFIKRNMHENDEFIKKILSMDENTIYKYITNNKQILNGILKEYLNTMTNEEEIELNKQDKQKILSINKLTILDV